MVKAWQKPSPLVEIPQKMPPAPGLNGLTPIANLRRGDPASSAAREAGGQRMIVRYTGHIPYSKDTVGVGFLRMLAKSHDAVHTAADTTDEADVKPWRDARAADLPPLHATQFPVFRGCTRMSPQDPRRVEWITNSNMFKNLVPRRQWPQHQNVLHYSGHQPRTPSRTGNA